MSNDTNAESDERRKWSPWAIAAAALLLVMFGIIAVGTLRGCFSCRARNKPPTADEKKKKEETEKTQRTVRSQVADRSPLGDQGGAAAREARPLGNRQPRDDGQLPRLRRRLAPLGRR